VKCIYRFPILGQLRLDDAAPVRARGCTYEFEIENGFATCLVVTTRITDRSQWPRIQRNPSPGVAALINPSAPHLPFLQFELRAVQGFLSLFGVERIDLRDPKIGWIPESEGERGELRLLSWGPGSAERDPRRTPPVPYELVARTLIAAVDLSEAEIPLAFYRRGKNDMLDKEYVEAVYDFFFLVESRYGEGKSRKPALMSAMTSNAELASYIQATLSDPGPIIAGSSKLSQEFQREYGRKTVSETIGHLVDLRGFLHHHAARRPGIWHPEEQAKYELDALFLQFLCYRIVFDLAAKHIWADSVVEQWLAQAPHQPGGK